VLIRDVCNKVAIFWLGWPDESIDSAIIFREKHKDRSFEAVSLQLGGITSDRPNLGRPGIA
jgi:hypothetical protein